MKSINDFLLGLDGQQKAIVSFIHQRLIDHHGLRQDMKYKIPMYAQKKWICYMNPIKKNGIELAFVKGHLLSNEQNLLDMKKRKYVAGIDLFDVSDITVSILDQIVQEALILDDLYLKMFSE